MNIKEIKIVVFLVCIFVCTCSEIAFAQSWKLVWSDEFDYTGLPDSANWGYEVGYPVRNNEDQYYTDARSSNVWVSEGQLVITALEESYGGAAYTSASLLTSGKHSWLFGRFEMRARIPAGPGMWPAFWTWGVNSTSWPRSGEIDIMEFYGDKVHANTVWKSTSSDPWHGEWDASYVTVSELEGANPNWRNEYHIWRMDWDSEAIRLYLDGVLVNETMMSQTYNPVEWSPPENPFLEVEQCIILNLAIGGSAGGDPTAGSYPAKYEIDYVRVYQLGFTDPTLLYSPEAFSEGGDNDGSIGNNVEITLLNETFTADVVSGGHVQAANVHPELTAQFTRDSDTLITMTLTGAASSHEDADDISNLTVTFADGAFVGDDASAVTNSTKNNLQIDFRPPVNVGLKLWYKFDDGNGTASVDSSGNGLDGTLINGPVWTAGTNGGALSFSGGDDYVERASDPLLDNSVMTVCFWMKTDGSWTTEDDDPEDLAMIIGRSSAGGSFSGFTVDQIPSYGKVVMQLKTGSGVVAGGLRSTTDLTDNEWHHVAIVMHQTAGGVNRIYVDTVQEDSSATTASWSFNNQVLRIAKSLDTGWWEEWKGQMDGLRIYDRELIQGDIQEIYDSAGYNVDGSPSVGNPSITAVATTNATLGGEVTTTNGSSIIERGIYWNATQGFSPPDAGNKVSESDTWGKGVFSNDVTGLSEASEVYFRAFAVNSSGATYAVESSFWTEPSGQPSNVVFTGVTNDSMTISWNGGSGAGRIVVMKMGTAVNADLQDGNEYAASSAFGSGADLGSGNYVVYRSTGTNVTVTGLLPDKPYHVKIYEYAGSGTGAGGINYQQDLPLTGNQATAEGSGVQYRLKIMFSGYDKSETLTDFPALVVLNEGLTNFLYSQFASPADGGDLRFYNAQAAILDYEIEKWDNGGDSYVWVKVPVLTNNACIYAYWGNSNNTTAAACTTNGATWSQDYIAVWHLSETTGAHLDSTPNDYDSATVTVTAQGTAGGPIAGADEFDGADDNIDFGNVDALNGVNQFTFSAWVEPGSLGDYDTIIKRRLDANNRTTLMLGGDWDPDDELEGGPDDLELAVCNASGNNVGYTESDMMTVGTPHYVTAVYNGQGVGNAERIRIYVDGVQYPLAFYGTIPATAPSISSSLLVGDLSAGVDGVVDEARISDIARSFDWIWACWSNQVPGSTFCEYGAAQDVTQDTDGDGLTDVDEIDIYGTDPDDPDTDNDGMADGWEYIADTDPTNPDSVLAITGIGIDGTDIRIDWKGGVMVTQFVEWCSDLMDTNDAWKAILTNEPPTATATNFLDTGFTNRARFYRIKVER